MIDLEARTVAAVALIHGFHYGGPVLRRGVNLALSAGRVPRRRRASGWSTGLSRGHKASGCYSRVSRGSLEKLRVCGGHNIGHHSPGARACDEDLARVARVLVKGVGNHVCNSFTVAAAIVSKSGLRSDVPTCTRVGRLRINDNEPVLICQVRVRRSRIVCLRGARTIVDCHDNRGLRC